MPRTNRFGYSLTRAFFVSDLRIRKMLVVGAENLEILAVSCWSRIQRVFPVSQL